MTFVRSLAYAVWFYLSMAVIGIGCMPFALVSRRAALGAIRFWTTTQRASLRILCGIRTEFRGIDLLPDTPCTIAMKHQSTYDTLAPFLFIANPVFILKKELLRAPVFGVYASTAGIAIDRSGHAKALRQMLTDAKAAAEKGSSIVIFPEGTRQEVDAPTDLKPGAYAIYRALGAPCVPVALNTGLCWKSFWRYPGHVVFEALPPIEPGLDRATFTQRLHDALDPATKRLVAEGRRAQGK